MIASAIVFIPFVVLGNGYIVSAGNRPLCERKERFYTDPLRYSEDR